ncbi:MAG: beta-1-3, beta-1-6-glucan biosynthesis protein [Xanthobacteraceae bacterium]
MIALRSRLLAALVGVVFAAAFAPWATAQDQKPAEVQKPPAAPPADAAKDDKKKIDEFADAAQAINGPAGNPECVWLGQRVVDRLFRDDLDTAFRHLDLYDRFGCPGAHIQASFRCVVRQGDIDPKSSESLKARVHACWVNPSLPPATAAAPPPTGTAGTAPPAGTSNQ